MEVVSELTGQFMTYFQCAIADSSVREVEFCTIVPYSSKNFLHMQTKGVFTH